MARLRLAAFEELVAQHAAVLLGQLVQPAVGGCLVDPLSLDGGIFRGAVCASSSGLLLLPLA